MKKQITLFLLLIVATILNANNIAVTNIKLTSQNITDDYTLVQFDISWENSWRITSARNNWDAAWIFVKYRIKTANGGDGLWHHACLNSDGHTAPTGSAIDVELLDPATAFNASSNPGLGAFVYRDAAGTGAFSKTGLQFRWNYGVNFKTGTTPIGDNDAMDVQVFAVEMVYVPAGSFYVGSGANNPLEAWSFTAANNTSGATVPFLITATAPTLQGNDAGSSATNLSARGAWAWDLTSTTTATFATGYPTGYGAFYCMKYEIC